MLPHLTLGVRMSCASPANSSKSNTCKTNSFLAKMLLLLVAPAQNPHTANYTSHRFMAPPRVLLP